MLAFYDFEGDANDRSGNSRHATLVSATLTTGGYEGQAYSFNGTGNLIRIPLNINPSVTTALTMGAWVYLDAVYAGPTVISHDDGGYDRTLTVDNRGSSGVSYSLFRGSQGVLGSVSAPTGRWVFLSARYDQANGLAILNVDDAQFTDSKFVMGSGFNYTHIGSNPGFGAYFAGRIDNVFFFDQVLSDAQIETIRTAGAGGILAVAGGSPLAPDVAVGMTAPATVRLGDLLPVSVEARNFGSLAALNSTLRIALPNYDLAQLVALPAGCTQTASDLTCTVGSVGPGATRAIGLAFLVKSAGTIGVSATIETSGPDVNPSNNLATSSTEVVTQGPVTGASASLSIANFSFEDPQLADGAFTTAVIPGWTTSGSAGVVNLTASMISGGTVPDGQNTGWSNSPTISQQLSTTLLAGTKYTLRVHVGRRLDIAYGGYRIELFAGGQLLASQSSAVAPGAGQFVEAVLEYTAATNDPLAGQPLEIRLTGLGGQTNFDNVRLAVQSTVVATPTGGGDADIPLPPWSVAMLGLILLGIIRRARSALH